MSKSAILSAAALALALPQLANAQHRAPNFHTVYPLSGGAFEVVSEPGSGAAQLWCGAADYALRRLGVASNQRIYLVRGIGPAANEAGRRSVVFSLTPPAGVNPATARNPLSLSLRGEGDSLSSASAVQYCRDHLGEDREIFIRP
jgi:hypothetical protein